MANKILLQEMDDTPPQICFADFATDFNPTAANDLRKGTDTEVQLSLASVADSTYRQSAKFDLGEHRAPSYAVRIAAEMAATPTAGDVIYLYAGPSSHATAATGNPGNLTGSDAAWDGYSTDGDNVVKHLELIGAFVCSATATATVMVGECGVFSPIERHGCLLVRNESNAAFFTDDVECHIVFDPIIPEIQ